MPDGFSLHNPALDSPATRAFAVTPDDGNDLSFVTRALYVGTTGNVAVVTAGDDTVTFSSVPAGAVLPVRAKRIRSTGTTAGNIVGMW